MGTAVQKSDPNKMKLKYGILIAISTQTSFIGIAPALPQIMAAFPDAGMSTIQSLITIPQLISIPANLLTTAIIPKTGKKVPLLIGIALIAIMGLLPVFIAPTLPMMLAFVALFGIGIGMVIPSALGLVTDHFSGPDLEDIMGKRTAFAGLCGVLMAPIAGYLALSGWRNTFWVYIYAILVFVIVLLTIPGDSMAGKTVEKKVDQPRAKLNSQVLVMLGFCLMCGLVCSALPPNSAIHVVERGIGDSAVSGLGTSMTSLASIVIGFIFGRLSIVLKNKSLATGMVVMVASMLTIAFAGNTFIFYVGCVLNGVALAIILPAAMSRTSVVAGNRRAAGVALAFYMAVNSCAVFLSPFVLNAISISLFDGSAQSRFIIAGVGAALLAVFAWFLCRNDAVQEQG